MVLVDTSSDSQSWFRQQGELLLRESVDEASSRAGNVFGDAIQADASSTIDFAFERTFRPSPDALNSGNDQNIIDNLKAQAEVAKDGVSKAFSRSRAASGSDFIGALAVAGERFSQPDIADRPRVLVIVGNLIQNTAGYRFDKMKLTHRQVTAIIDRLKSTNGLAKLDGVQVVFVGTGLRQPRLRSQQQGGIREFFKRYVEASGGHVLLWAPRLQTLPAIDIT